MSQKILNVVRDSQRKIPDMVRESHNGNPDVVFSDFCRRRSFYVASFI